MTTHNSNVTVTELTFVIMPECEILNGMRTWTKPSHFWGGLKHGVNACCTRFFIIIIIIIIIIIPQVVFHLRQGIHCGVLSSRHFEDIMNLVWF